MARSEDRPRKQRFSKSGHTSHQPRVTPPDEPHRDPPPRYDPPPARYDPPTARYAGPPPRYDPPPPRYEAPPPRYEQPSRYEQPTEYGVPPVRVPPPGRVPPGADDGFDPPTYHGGPPPSAHAGTHPGTKPAVAIGRAAFTHTNRAARIVTRKVIDASKSDGAEESGLTHLIWNQVLSYGTDAMITVALAGTVFFGASTHAQRGNVLLYLVITMAPFAVVAPVIGPALDRLQHGRRWTMAGTAIGRAILALIMAAHPTELLVLYPCALGSLVLSKAYAVVRAAAAPRLVPQGMTLTEANARLSIFGLASTLVLGGAVGIVIKLTGSYSMGLWLTAIGFGVCAFFAFRLPAQIDSTAAAERHPDEPPRPRTQDRVPPLTRIRSWARRGFEPHLVVALQGESALRLLSGLLTIYLAFYVEGTRHGLAAALDLGAIVGAAGVGNFSGTAIGTKLRMARPEVVIVASAVVSAVVCVVVALSFGILFAVIGMYLSAVGNALSKIALDALIQRDVVETLRSSAFARSETFLQLAWVVGAAIGVLLPTDHGGAIGFWVAAVVLVAVAVVVVLRLRVLGRPAVTPHQPPTTPPMTPPMTQRIPSSAAPDVPPPPGSVDMRKTRPY